MGKLKGSTSQLRPSLDQASFLRMLDVVEGWDHVRASEDEIDHLSERLTDTDEVATYQTLLADANAYAASLRQAAPALEGVEARVLALLVCGGEAVHRGMRLCLPASLTGVSDAHRMALFLAIVHGRAVHLRVDPAPWVRLAVMLRVLGPWAIREVMARVNKHVGASYGLVAYLLGKSDAEGELQDVLKQLQGLPLSRVGSASARQEIAARRKGESQSGMPEISSATFALMDELQLLNDPLTGLLVGLDGQLDTFHWKVASQLKRDLVGRRHYREISIHVRPDNSADADSGTSLEQSIPGSAPSALEALIQDEQVGEQERLMARLVAESARLCAEKGKHRVAYEALTGQKPIVTLAKEHRKDPDTITRWTKNFVKELSLRLRGDRRYW
jgi:hypothetical protein